ncbi:RNA polymerase III RPC4-domain-containing protein [Dactylonectria estremocensis]|uniref:RNA polymerase III RPC4-domain-containing protein n=1 Tax=Dactylonectria estremocensis TaxID=1079267 RepID=A0A9P9F2L8_9HYPO|nr:RNA polymerase III RPC4-domain-containing protein [Dactylonectria estremocensis]
MVRGRVPARGTRRGAAAAGQRAQAETGESSTSAASAATGTANASTRSTPSVAPRGGATTRATRGPATGRYRPKVVRRDEAERDSLARQEEQKAQDRAADERRARGRSRFRSKRSRGDAMGARGGFGRPIGGASGPFSSSVGGGSGGWFGGGGGGGFGGGGGSFPRSFKKDSKAGFAQADGSRYREPRINADKLNINTQNEELDSDDEAMFAALSGRPTSILPMGIYRKEHKDEGVVVVTMAELEAADNDNEEESLWIDEDGQAPETLADQPEEGGVWGTDGNNTVIVKKEPGLDDSMDLDEIKTPTETKEKTKGKAPAVLPPIRKAAPQDPEERMIQTDLNLLASELGAVTITTSESSEGAEGGEDREAKEAKEVKEVKAEGLSNKDGRMYLFQFPPVLPPLKQVAQPNPINKVKPEPADSNMLDSTPSADTAPVDLTEEDGNPASGQDAEDDPENTLGFLSQLLSQGGMVGQLKVRKSGRVELDWGGQILEMSPAAGMNFLTTAVIVEDSDEKPKPGVIGGEGIGMGKIMGRFVLAPTWQEEEDWDVSPEELKIN